MASSNLMMKMSSDLIRRKSSNSSSSSSTNHHHHLNHNHNQKHPSIVSNNSGVFPLTVDGLSRNNNEQEITLLDAAGAVTAIHETEAAGTIRRQESVRTSCNGGEKSVHDVWKEIVGCKQEEEEMMTLEDFLAKAGAVQVKQEDVKIPLASIVDGRKRRAMLEEEPLDKAAHQRQRRMIKNRESAARSRERKQAYQAELESLALKLQEENDILLKDKAERTKKRYTQLIDKIIPVTDKGRGMRRRQLRKVRSMEW